MSAANIKVNNNDIKTDIETDIEQIIYTETVPGIGFLPSTSLKACLISASSFSLPLCTKALA